MRNPAGLLGGWLQGCSHHEVWTMMAGGQCWNLEGEVHGLLSLERVWPSAVGHTSPRKPCRKGEPRE